jgi:acyl dehydratase
MEPAEIKVPSVEERLASVQKLIGVDKYNSVTMSTGLPPGCYISNHVASGDNIRRWACAIGDLNPRFLDSEYAETTKHGRLAAPPLFLQSVCYEAIGNILADIPGVRGFHSGSEWEFFQPVLEDDKLDYNGIAIADVKLKKSKFSSHMLVTTSICQYRNQRGEIVGLAKGFVHHSASDQVATSIGKYDDIAKPYRYSDEEIRKIEKDKEKEEMRGSKPRYWEDVVEGESIGHLVIGPHTIFDSIAHMTSCWGALPLATGSRLYRIWEKRGIPIKVYDPRINAYVNVDLPHLDYELGRAVGAQGAYDNGAERECLVSILFTNWMGDDGFLWKYSIQFRRFVVHGDTNWYQGKIIRKYIDDGKCCVDIEHWGDNQRAERTTTGQATVILPSKINGPVKFPKPRSLEDIFPVKE